MASLPALAPDAAAMASPALVACLILAAAAVVVWCGLATWRDVQHARQHARRRGRSRRIPLI